MADTVSPWFNAEHELFRGFVRDFVQKEVIPNVDAWEREERIPRSVFERMGELGLLGINFPESQGGTGNDFFHTVVYLEELARAKSAGIAAAVGVHQFMATAHIARVGSEYLVESYLKPAIAGTKWGSLGISEPGAGSDVASISTTAVRDGDHYVINGSKTFITNGVYGDFVTVACKTDPAAGAGGISLIVVDQGTPGFSATKLDKIGWRSSDTAELSFIDVRVPVRNLIGVENQGFYYIMDSFQLERLVAAIMAVGGADDAIEMTLQYMNEREAFGRKLNRIQVLRHRLADLATELEAARQLTYFASWQYENGVFNVKECSMAKLLTSELGKKVADICLQCFGGYGYMESYPIARMYRDARVGTIVGGTSEIMREIITKMMIDGRQYDSGYRHSGAKNPEKDQTQAMNANASDDAGAHAPVSQTDTSTEPLNQPMEHSPTSARDIILSLPQRFKADQAPAGLKSSVHFEIEGDRGGHFTVHLEEGHCRVEEGLVGDATCVIRAKDKHYEAIELGKTNPQMAFMMGKIKVSDLGEMMRFIPLFQRLH